MHTEDSKTDTVSNGTSFRKSSSNASTNEISIEDSKTISIEDTISKVTSNTISYTVSQTINNVQEDGGCYEYEITLQLRYEAIVWACGINDDFEGDHVEFYTDVVIKNDGEKYILNKTDCSKKNNVKNL